MKQKSKLNIGAIIFCAFLLGLFSFSAEAETPDDNGYFTEGQASAAAAEAGAAPCGENSDTEGTRAVFTPDLNWSDWQVIDEPTCVEEGQRMRVNDQDFDTPRYEYETIPATGKHTYTETTTAADCIHAGEMTYTCSVCGDTYTDKLPPTGVHQYSKKITREADCGHPGEITYTCSICEDTYTETVPATGQHKYEVTSKKMMDEKNEQTTYTCSVCGDTYTEIRAIAFEPSNSRLGGSVLPMESKPRSDENTVEDTSQKYMLALTPLSPATLPGLAQLTPNSLDYVLTGLLIIGATALLLPLIPKLYVLLWYRRKKRAFFDREKEKIKGTSIYR